MNAVAATYHTKRQQCGMRIARCTIVRHKFYGYATFLPMYRERKRESKKRKVHQVIKAIHDTLALVGVCTPARRIFASSPATVPCLCETCKILEIVVGKSVTVAYINSLHFEQSHRMTFRPLSQSLLVIRTRRRCGWSSMVEWWRSRDNWQIQ